MLDLIGLAARYSGRVKNTLVLPRAQRHHVLYHDRFQLLSLDRPPVLQAGVYHGGRPRRLVPFIRHHDRVHAVEIRVYHQRRAASQVHVFFPPIRHVVRGPPRLELQISLQLHPDSVLELLRQLNHLFVVLVVQQRARTSQVLQQKSNIKQT